MSARGSSRLLSRRQALGAAAAASGTGLLAASPAAAGEPRARGAAGPRLLDPRNAADRDLLYRKLHFRSDDGVVFWWLEGPKFGQVGATLTPLFTNLVGTIQRVRQRSDGGFDLTSLEMVFQLDLASGARLEQWRNPYTNETIPMRPFRPVGPTTVRYRPDGTRVLPTELGGSRLESSATVHAPIVHGDDVFVRDESIAKVYSPGRTQPFEVNDIAIYHGSLANLSDPRVSVGDASVFFAEVTGWQSWMRMGDRPGSLTSRCPGRKVKRYEDMPEQWRELVASAVPDIARDPLAALDRPAAEFVR